MLPTHSENFGISVAEALASRSPAIVTKSAPWGGLVKEGAGGGLISAWRDSLRVWKVPLVGHEKNLRRWGCGGREWMEAEFSWSRIGKMMAQTYQ